MDGVGEGEGVQHRIPVAELVGGVEARDPQRGRVGHRAGQLLGRRAVAQRCQQRVDVGLRVVGEQLLGQRDAPIPAGAAAWMRARRRRPRPQPGSCSKLVSRMSIRSIGLRQAFDSSMRLARAIPLTRLASTGSAMLPAGDVERLERLVGEVGRVADLDVAVVGDRREQHVGHLGAGGARAHGRDHAALGALVVAHLDELAEPALERRQVGADIGQRVDHESAAACRTTRR